MMLVISLITLVIASTSAFLSLNIQDEVFKAAMVCVAVLFLFVTLICAPWAFKLTIGGIPMVFERINKWSAESSSN